MEQQVFRKLGSIVNRLEGRKRVERHRDTVLYSLYSYGHETALVLTALGLSHPLVDVLSAEDGSAAPAQAGFLTSLASYPIWLLIVVGLLVTFWIFTRVTVNYHKLGDKVPLYRACSRELGRVESDLEAALATEQPLAPLSEIQTQIKEIVDRYYAAGGWPWPIAPPGIDEVVERRAGVLCARFSGSWERVPDQVQQVDPAA